MKVKKLKDPDKKIYSRVFILKSNGEKETFGVISEREELTVQRKKTELSPSQKLYLNKQNDLKKQCYDLGGYIHMLYTKNEILFNGLSLDKANITRIIYLATYMDFQQKGLLVYQPKDKEGRFLPSQPINKKTMQNILGLGDTAFKKFLKDMKENKIIFEVEKKFYIDTQYFIKGGVENFNKKEQSYCRLFIDTVRAIYGSCKAKEHKTLANVYQLIPFVHYSNNMVCHNPYCLESDTTPISLKEIGDLLGIEDNSSNLKRLVKDLESIKVNIKDKEYKLFAYTKMKDKDFFFVNPYVVYSGNKVDNIRWVADTYFFRGQNNK